MIDPESRALLALALIGVGAVGMALAAHGAHREGAPHRRMWTHLQAQWVAQSAPASSYLGLALLISHPERRNHAR